MFRPVNIILVEDNPADVLWMQETLKEAGVKYSMKVLEDGEEAINYLHRIAAKPELRPHVIVLDLNLPKKDGHDVLIALRSLRSLDKLLVVVLTTSENPEDKRRVLAHNAAYIVKPANLGNLSQILETLEIAYNDISVLPTPVDIGQARNLLKSKKISKILIVEDNPNDVLLIQEIIKDSSMADCELITVEDLESALTALATQQIDIILADLGLPDAQGLHALTGLLAAAEGTPVIVLTGLDDEALAEEAVSQGAQDYLVKGQVDFRSLSKSVRYAVTRKRAEELALMTVASESNVLREILECAPISMARFTPDLIVSTCNSAFSRQLRLDPLSIVGASITELLLDFHISLWHKVVAEGTPFHLQCTLHEGEPHETNWEGSVWPIKSRDDDIKGGIILALDVTERIKLERQREDFIASLAHDIRNPLIGADRLLSFMSEENLTREQHVDMIAALKQSNSNVLTMLQNLLDIYKYEASAAALYFQPIEIKDALEAAISYTKLIALEREVSVTLDLPDHLPTLMADINALQRLFSNLLHNALKFSQPGDNVNLTGFAKNDELVIVFADGGLGMTKDQQDCLFKRFGESRSTKYSGGSGTGLGLYLCKQIVDAHHGSILCQSEEGQGTTFTINFPLQDKAYSSISTAELG